MQITYVKKILEEDQGTMPPKNNASNSRFVKFRYG